MSPRSGLHCIESKKTSVLVTVSWNFPETLITEIGLCDTPKGAISSLMANKYFSFMIGSALLCQVCWQSNSTKSRCLLLAHDQLERFKSCARISTNRIQPAINIKQSKEVKKEECPTAKIIWRIFTVHKSLSDWPRANENTNIKAQGEPKNWTRRLERALSMKSKLVHGSWETRSVPSIGASIEERNIDVEYHEKRELATRKSMRKNISAVSTRRKTGAVCRSQLQDYWKNSCRR